MCPVSPRDLVLSAYSGLGLQECAKNGMVLGPSSGPCAWIANTTNTALSSGPHAFSFQPIQCNGVKG